MIKSSLIDSVVDYRCTYYFKAAFYHVLRIILLNCMVEAPQVVLSSLRALRILKVHHSHWQARGHYYYGNNERQR